MTIKSAKTMREQAAQLAQMYASERDACGDPEGANEFRDLAKAIKRIPLNDK